MRGLPTPHCGPICGCSGKIAVVIGGTRGIGRATCLALAEAGATVAVTGRSRSRVDEVVKEVKERGQRVNHCRLAPAMQARRRLHWIVWSTVTGAWTS